MPHNIAASGRSTYSRLLVFVAQYEFRAGRLASRYKQQSRQLQASGPEEEEMRQIELFAEHIIPAFR